MIQPTKRTYRRGDQRRTEQFHCWLSPAELQAIHAIVSQQQRIDPNFSQSDFVARCIALWQAMTIAKN